MKKPWKAIRKTRVLTTPVFDVHELAKSRPSEPDNVRRFYVLDAVDWVNVIPVTSAGEVVFIELYRQGTDEWSLEVPGGMIDPEDASPAAAASRELSEETGYGSTNLVELGCVEPNPALQANRCHSFYAPNAEKLGPQRLDPGEDIRVVLHRLESVPELMRSGRIRHSLVVAAFYWLIMHQSDGKLEN